MRLTDVGFRVSKYSNTRRTSELEVATYVACHTSVKAVDHLGELICSTCNKDVKIHQTKYTLLINNVVAPCMFKEC